MQNQAD